jgi:hypothetical protein
VVQSEALGGGSSRFTTVSNFQLIDDDVPIADILGAPVPSATQIGGKIGSDIGIGIRM